MKTALQSAPILLAAAIAILCADGCAGGVNYSPTSSLTSTTSGASAGTGTGSATGTSGSGTSSGTAPSSGSSTSTGSTTSTGSSSSGGGSGTSAGSTSGSTGGSSGTGSGSGSSGSGSGTAGSGASGSGSSGSGDGTALPLIVPYSAVGVTGIQALSSWKAAYDTGTGGSSATSSGVMSLEATPSESGQAREFNTTYTNYGGERYYISFGADTVSTNLFYDVWVYLPAAPTDIANLEFDMNQVMANGQTIIYGFQCDGWSGTWDYTENAGTPQAPVDRWLHSSASCNVKNWSIQTWHHVQVYYSRDAQGDVSYNTVWLDGVEQSINQTVPSAFALGWGSTLLTNFQVDGIGASGSSTVYLDQMAVYRW